MFSHLRISWCMALLILLGATVGAQTAPAQTEEAGGGKTLHILAIGISKYQYYKAGQTPRFAAKDAQDFTTFLEGVARGGFAHVKTHLLLDEQATRAAIAQAAEEVMSEAGPQDTFVFFYSGHGATRTLGPKKDEQFYLLPTNFNPAGGNRELYDMGIAGGLLQSWFLKIQSQHQLVVLNSSRSGRGLEGFIARAEVDNKFLANIARRDFALVFINKASYEFNSLKNGLLPYLLVEGLKGGAASDGGVVTVKKLIDYVEQNSRDVIVHTGDTALQRLIGKFGKTGIPSSYFSGKDFPLGVKPDGAAGRSGSAVRRRGAQSAFPKASVAADSRRNILSAAYERPYAGGDARDGTAASRQNDEHAEYILPAECAPLSEFHPSTSGWRRGKDHALLFGTDTYDKSDKWTPLNNPVFDATSIAEVLNTRFGFETEVVKNADLPCFGAYLTKYATKKYANDEQLFIFIAGHGEYRSNIDGFIILKNSEAADLPGLSFFSHSLLARMINYIPCKHTFLILDSCFGGAMATAAKAEGDRPSGESGEDSSDNPPAPDSDEEFIKMLMQFRTRRFLSSGGIDYVEDGPAGQHSPFAKKLLAALNMGRVGHTFITDSDIAADVKRMPPFNPVPLFDAWKSNDGRGEFFFISSPAPSP
jgi:hypothetical protein